MPGNPSWCPLSSAVLVGPSNEIIENSMVRKLRRLGKVRTKRTTRTKRNTRKTRRKDLNKEAYSISWHILAYLDICKVSQYLSIFLNISSTAAYDVIFCNAPAGPFRTNMLHCSNQVSNFVRRPLTTPKPWAHGLQVEVDLKNIEPAALLSALKMHAAAHCSPAAHWQWEERRRCSKFCWDRRGSPSLVPACSLTVRLWTTPQPRNVTDSHNLPWLATCPAKCWVKWAGHMLVIGWSCSGIQQLEAPRCPKMSQDVPRCPKMSQDVPRCPKMSQVSSRVAIKTYSAIRSCSAGSRPRSFW